MNRHEPTAHERELLGDPLDYRGYSPDDDVPEPVEGPSEPAGAAVDPTTVRDPT